MSLNVGLTAIVEPEVDSRKADREAKKLKEKFGAAEELEPTADTRSLERQLNDVTLSPEVEGVGGADFSPPGGGSTAGGVGGAAAGGGRGGGGGVSEAATGASLASVAKGGLLKVSLAGAVGYGILKGVNSIAKASPAWVQTTSMFGDAINLFFRPFGRALANVFTPMAMGMLEMALRFNEIASEDGLKVAIANLAGEAEGGLEELLTGDGEGGTDPFKVGGAGLGAAAGGAAGFLLGGPVGAGLGMAAGGALGSVAGGFAGDKIGPAASSAKSSVEGAIDSASGKIESGAGDFVDAVSDLTAADVGEKIEDSAGDLADKIESGAGSAADALESGAGSAADAVERGAEDLSKFIDNFDAREMFTGAVELGKWIFDGAVGLGRWIFSGTVGLGRWIFAGSVKVGRWLFAGSIDIAEYVSGKLSIGSNAAGGVVTQPGLTAIAEREPEVVVPFSKIGAFAESVASGEKPSGIIPDASKVPIPGRNPGGSTANTGSLEAGAGGSKYDTDVKLAKGGVVTSPTQALVGESGAEAVMPLRELKNAIQTAVKVAVESPEVRGSDIDDEAIIDAIEEQTRVLDRLDPDVEISLDGKTLAEVSRKASERHRGSRVVSK